uniref:Uncharacterized protein n=1 Tax=Mycena chlorophos TaxID=658473 RepID=A0ABQ0M0L5_MYCCL|nr:predicted protein [Mycena chlorophos]
MSTVQIQTQHEPTPEERAAAIATRIAIQHSEYLASYFPVPIQQQWPRHNPPADEYSPLEPNLQLPYMPPSLAQLRCLPPLPSLPDFAPSRDPSHPFSILSLAAIGSGNAHPAPARTQCAECILTEKFKSMQARYSGTGNERVSRFGPAREEMTLMRNEFRYKNSNQHVLLADFLDFGRANEIKNATQTWVTHPLNSGLPVEVLLRIIGDSRDFRVLLETKDVLYLNCAHQRVTHHQIGYFLAWGFKHLIKTKLPGYNWRQFELVTFQMVDEGRGFVGIAQLREN